MNQHVRAVAMGVAVVVAAASWPATGAVYCMYSGNASGPVTGARGVLRVTLNTDTRELYAEFSYNLNETPAYAYVQCCAAGLPVANAVRLDYPFSSPYDALDWTYDLTQDAVWDSGFLKQYGYDKTLAMKALADGLTAKQAAGSLVTPSAPAGELTHMLDLACP